MPAPAPMKTLWKRILCFFGGHPCEPTGRRGIVMKEWRCQRCGGLYVSHADYGRCLLPADATTDMIFATRDWLHEV